MSVERLRVGQGYDVHRFLPEPDPDRPLVLGGVTFPSVLGLEGHSDADVIAHACTDALLGPSDLGDIGTLFPSSDQSLAGADSLGLLQQAVQRLTEAGWQTVNIDCTVVCDKPKLAPHRDAIEANLSAIVGAPVTVKGKTTEKMAGLADGITCIAAALLLAP